MLLDFWTEDYEDILTFDEISRTQINVLHSESAYEKKV